MYYINNILVILCIYINLLQYFVIGNLKAFNKSNYTLISSVEYRNYVTSSLSKNNKNSDEDTNSIKVEINIPSNNKNNNSVYQLHSYQKVNFCFYLK